MTDLTFITLFTFSPLIGVVALLFVRREQERTLKTVGTAATIIPLVLALFMYIRFQTGAEAAQFAGTVDWITLTVPTAMQAFDFVITYSLGVDGLSMPLMAMTAIVTTLAAVASMYIKRKWKSYFMFLLLLEVGMLGVFAARDLFLFFLFFEVTLVTTFILIGGWGPGGRSGVDRSEGSGEGSGADPDEGDRGERDPQGLRVDRNDGGDLRNRGARYVNYERAANQFLLYNGLGSLIMLVAFIVIWYIYGTMQYDQLAERIGDFNTQLGLLPATDWLTLGTFFALIVAFGIKLPFFPFHTWMLRVHVAAPPPIVMIHSGVLLKMGAYGLIRFAAGLFPAYMQDWAVLIGVLGVINILYGAVLALVQTELKRVIAYSSISHMGIVLLGLAALNVAGLQGAVFQMVSHGFISALLFFFIAALSARTGTTDIRDLGGLAKTAPILCGIFLAAGMATLGLPGMSGFISEFLAFLGIFQTAPVLGAIGALGIILAAVYTLRAVLATSFGPLRAQWADLPDTRAREAVPMLVLLGFIVLIGVYPAVLNAPLQLTLETIVSRIGG